MLLSFIQAVIVFVSDQQNVSGPLLSPPKYWIEIVGVRKNSDVFVDNYISPSYTDRRSAGMSYTVTKGEQEYAKL